MRPIFTDKTHNKNSERKPINTTIQLPHMSAINLTLLHCTIGNFGLFPFCLIIVFLTHPIEISTSLLNINLLGKLPIHMEGKVYVL